MAQTFKISDGDINISASSGRPVLVSGAAKLSQDIKEFFTIDVQPNGFGAGLEQLIGVVEVSQEVFSSITDRQIRQGLATFINLIKSDARIQRSDSERIVGISNVQVSIDTVDPTKIFFSVNILTQNGLDMQISDSIQI